MTVRSAEQALEHNVALMGEDLGRLYSALWQEVAWLYRKWEEYVTLFGTKPERIELLNQAAPAFFRVVQDTLWEDVLMHICRLTDPPKSAGRPNLTCQRLGPLLTDERVQDSLAAAISAALLASEFCRDWRNRRIAHHDLDLAFGTGADPLLPASREGVKAALSAIAKVLDTVSSHFANGTTFFGAGANSGDAHSLLYVLDDGLACERERRARLRAGTATNEDFRRREL